MSELEQIERLQRTIRELRALKIIEPKTEPPKNKLSQNQIFAAGQVNMLVRVNDVINKHLGTKYA